MPDKEFDNLFRDKFEDAEIEPSTNLWANIEAQLEPKKKKRVVPIYWMAAASVAVAITAMLVFQKKEVLQLHGKDQLAVVVPTTIQPDAIGTVTAVAPVTKNTTATDENKTGLTNSRQAIQTPEKATQENNLKNSQDDMQPNTMIASLEIKKADPIPVKVADEKEPVIENKTVIASNPTPKSPVETMDTEIEDSQERKGIRNVGDLVNFVVDKVDKRDKKILKFNTDDDDNSSIIGINIGFVKLNSRKHK